MKVRKIQLKKCRVECLKNLKVSHSFKEKKLRYDEILRIKKIDWSTIKFLDERSASGDS